MGYITPIGQAISVHVKYIKQNIKYRQVHHDMNEMDKIKGINFVSQTCMRYQRNYTYEMIRERFHVLNPTVNLKNYEPQIDYSSFESTPSRKITLLKIAQ